MGLVLSSVGLIFAIGFGVLMVTGVVGKTRPRVPTGGRRGTGEINSSGEGDSMPRVSCPDAVRVGARARRRHAGRRGAVRELPGHFRGQGNEAEPAQESGRGRRPSGNPRPAAGTPTRTTGPAVAGARDYDDEDDDEDDDRPSRRRSRDYDDDDDDDDGPRRRCSPLRRRGRRGRGFAHARDHRSCSPSAARS